MFKKILNISQVRGTYGKAKVGLSNGGRFQMGSKGSDKELSVLN